MSPRYSIIPGDFAADQRADVGHFRVMNLIGRHTDAHGWCRLKQLKIGKEVGLSRETVNRKIKDLVDWGYVDKRSADATGRAIFYRTIMDRPGPLPVVQNDDAAGPDFGPDAPELDLPEPPTGRVTPASHAVTTKKPSCNRHVIRSLTPGVSAARTSGVTHAATANNDPSLTATSSTTKKDSPPPPRKRGARERARSNLVSGWLELLAADGVNMHVVELLLRPVLSSLSVEHAAPVDLLRSIRDQRVLAEIPSHVLSRLAVHIKECRKKLVSVKDITDEIAAVTKNVPMLVITPEDPNWDAWCEDLRRSGHDKLPDVFRRQGHMRVWTAWPSWHENSRADRTGAGGKMRRAS